MAATSKAAVAAQAAIAVLSAAKTLVVAHQPKPNSPCLEARITQSPSVAAEQAARQAQMLELGTTPPLPPSPQAAVVVVAHFHRHRPAVMADQAAVELYSQPVAQAQRTRVTTAAATQLTAEDQAEVAQEP